MKNFAATKQHISPKWSWTLDQPRPTPQNLQFCRGHSEKGEDLAAPLTGRSSEFKWEDPSAISTVRCQWIFIL